MSMKGESEKAGLKLNSQKTRIMAFGPITSLQINGETMETVRDFIFQGSKITADGDCSPEIKRCLLLGRKAITNLDSILKSRDITLPTKVHLIKAIVFPVVLYGCQRWTIKKAECWRIDAFELWCWQRLLRVPWTAKISNQSILKEISPERSLEGLMLKLKLQYFGHLMQRADSFESIISWCRERLKTGGEGDDRGWDGRMVLPTQWTWVWASSGSWCCTGKPGGVQSMGSQRVRHDSVTELNYWCFDYYSSALLAWGLVDFIVGQNFSAQRDFFSKRTSSNIWRQFHLSWLGRSCYWHLVCGSQRCC